MVVCTAAQNWEKYKSYLDLDRYSAADIDTDIDI